MFKSRSFLAFAVFALAFLVLSTAGDTSVSTIAFAEGGNPGGCDADTCPPDTSEPGLNTGPDEDDILVMAILLGWLRL